MKKQIILLVLACAFILFDCSTYNQTKSTQTQAIDTTNITVGGTKLNFKPNVYETNALITLDSLKRSQWKYNH